MTRIPFLMMAAFAVAFVGCEKKDAGKTEEKKAETTSAAPTDSTPKTTDKTSTTAAAKQTKENADGTTFVSLKVPNMT